MSAFLSELKFVAQSLNQLNVAWALVGALAYSVHAEPRTTKDIDVAVAVGSAADLERIVDKLIGLGFRNKQLLMHVSPVHRMGIRVFVPATGAYSVAVNMLSASCGIEAEIVQSAMSVEILPGLIVPVARLSHVLAMKLLSQDDFDRIRDKADVNALITQASPPDLAEAITAIKLITERGFNRGKDLLAEFNSSLRLRSR